MPRRILIDTDPGQDDGVAILLTLASPDEIEVAGVIVVAGNVPLRRTATKACKLLEAAERTDIPVFAGCPRPLMRAPVTAEHVHGTSGLDGRAFAEPSGPWRSSKRPGSCARSRRSC